MFKAFLNNVEAKQNGGAILTILFVSESEKFVELLPMEVGGTIDGVKEFVRRKLEVLNGTPILEVIKPLVGNEIVPDPIEVTIDPLEVARVAFFEKVRKLKTAESLGRPAEELASLQAEVDKEFKPEYLG